MPKLSVIIPCFNGFEYLKQMVDCCIKQTYKDWELILVDDGSTDGTYEMISEYAKQDSRIKVLQREREPKGSVVCRNIGFEKSSGEYIIHFDADDLISDICFERRVNFLDNNKDCDYASFWAQGFTIKDGKFKYSDRNYYGVSCEKQDLLERFLTVRYPFSIWCNIYRRSSILQFPWDEAIKVYSDFSYALPIIFAGLKHKFADNLEPDYYYRRFYTQNNMCASAINEQKCESTLYLFDKTLSALEKREDFDDRKKQFLHFIILHFERLCLGATELECEKYINMVSKYYTEQTTNKLRLILSKIKNKKGHFKEFCLFILLYHSFGYKGYRIQAIHSFAKILLYR